MKKNYFTLRLFRHQNLPHITPSSWRAGSNSFVSGGRVVCALSRQGIQRRILYLILYCQWYLSSVLLPLPSHPLFLSLPLHVSWIPVLLIVACELESPTNRLIRRCHLKQRQPDIKICARPLLTNEERPMKQRGN